MRFNPPPNWPPAPPGWSPKPGWRPPEDWGEPPYGWQLWLPDESEPVGEESVTPPELPEPASEEVAAEPSPPERVWKKALDHPVWTTFGAIVGIVGLVISVVQIVQTFQTPDASLEIAAVTIDGEQSMQGAVTGGVDADDGLVGLTPIDLTLQNTGGEPSLITRVDAEVVFFKQLRDCTFTPPTPETVAVKYQLPVPMNGAEPAEKQVSAEVRFEVKPHAADRMVLTLGPQSQSMFETTPMLMSAKVTLIHDDGEALDVGTVSLVTTIAAANAQRAALRETPSAEAISCAKANLEDLDEMFAIQARRSGVLDSLRTAYQRAAA